MERRRDIEKEGRREGEKERRISGRTGPLLSLSELGGVSSAQGVGLVA